MKKLLYTLLAVSIIFAACKKEDETVTPTVISGCMDALALNYNASATTDDGSCTYTTIISGCTDSTATNYNPLATIDDGSCIFGIVGIWTPTSVTQDSSLTTIIDGDTVTDLMGETMTYSGSITMTPEESGVDGNMEFTDNGLAITFDDTSTYIYSNNVVTITDEDGDAIMNLAHPADWTADRFLRAARRIR